jgi:HEAT repeat protein
MPLPRLRPMLATLALVSSSALFVYVIAGRNAGVRLRGPTPAAYWIQKVRRGEVTSQCVGLRRLGELRPAEGLPLVLDKLGSEVLAVRLAAVRALGRYEASEAVAPLVALLDAPHPMLRDAAVTALGEIGDPAALEPLRAMLTPGGLGLQAGEAIGRLRTPEAEAVLVAALRSEDPWVRRGAIAGLESCGSEAGLEALHRLMKQPLDGLDPVLLEALCPSDADEDRAAAEQAARDRITQPIARAMRAIEARLGHQGGKRNAPD